MEPVLPEWVPAVVLEEDQMARAAVGAWVVRHQRDPAAIVSVQSVDIKKNI
jgi:hypothetical protein